MNQWIIVNDDAKKFWPLTWEGDDPDTAMELAYNFSGFNGNRAYVGEDVPDGYEMA